jgi:hypothetical protein
MLSEPAAHMEWVPGIKTRAWIMNEVLARVHRPLCSWASQCCWMASQMPPVPSGRGHLRRGGPDFHRGSSCAVRTRGCSGQALAAEALRLRHLRGYRARHWRWLAGRVSSQQFRSSPRGDPWVRSDDMRPQAGGCGAIT